MTFYRRYSTYNSPLSQWSFSKSSQLSSSLEKYPWPGRHNLRLFGADWYSFRKISIIKEHVLNRRNRKCCCKATWCTPLRHRPRIFPSHIFDYFGVHILNLAPLWLWLSYNIMQFNLKFWLQVSPGSRCVIRWRLRINFVPGGGVHRVKKDRDDHRKS